MCNWEGCTITNSERLRRIRRLNIVEVTMIGCHVGGCTGVHVPLLVAGELHVVERGDESRVDLLLIEVVVGCCMVAHAVAGRCCRVAVTVGRIGLGRGHGGSRTEDPGA